MPNNQYTISIAQLRIPYTTANHNIILVSDPNGALIYQINGGPDGNGNTLRELHGGAAETDANACEV